MQRPFALPGTKPRYAPDRVVDVEHYRLELALDVDHRRIEGSCAITVAPIADRARILELDAVELDVREVRDGERKLDFSHDGRRLRIDLGRPLSERATITVAYAASPRRGLYFIAPDEMYPRRPRQIWTQGQDEDSRYWFPCFDSPNEKSTSEVIATVPSSWFALSNGELTRVDGNGSTRTRTFHWRFDVPHSCYLITLAAGELTEIEEKWGDVELRTYVEKGREADARRACARTADMLALFSERFGVRYPYHKYAQVFVAEFIFGGMENTTATTLTDNALYDERAALDYDVESLVAHELAHQWFGDLLTCRDWGEGWLNEGFATYAEYVWREHAHGRDEAAWELGDWAEQYFGEDSRRYRRPIATNVYEEPIDVFDHHLYEKGGLVLHMLRRILGESAFWKAIGHYVRKHARGSVETRDLARAIGDATGRTLDWFFEQWVQKAGHPELAVEYTWDDDTKIARFIVRQTQKVDGETPLFRLPLDVRFRVAGKDVDQRIEIDEAHQVFFFPFDEKPTQAIFDAGQHTLKRAEVTKPRPLWLAELAGATEAIDRAGAARALGKESAPEAVEALAKTLAADHFWGVQAAAAEALGAIRSPAARDALVRALRSTKHPKARRAVAKTLGEFRRDDVAAAALEPIARHGDESYFVEAEACLALGKTRTARAPGALRAALERDSYLDIVRQHAYRGLAEARDDTALPLLYDGMEYGRVPQGRRAAVMALATLVQGRRDREARDARERIEELLFDPDFRVQLSAIEALATIGDARAIESLRRVAEIDLDGRIKRRAREVIRDLEELTGRDEAVKGMRDEMETLRAGITALREKVAKLESAGKKPPPAPKKPPPAPKKPPPAPKKPKGRR